MNTFARVTLLSMKDILKSRWSIIFLLFFSLITEGLFQLSESSSKVLLNLISMSLIILPLIAIIFGVMYNYNSREFIELLLTHPVNRSAVYSGLYLGLTLSLGICYSAGLVLPSIFHSSYSGQQITTFILLLLIGIALIASFVAISFVIATIVIDKGRGLGFVILIWLFFAVVYDGLILFVIYQFSAYPIEKAVMAMTMFNPIDLARISLLLHTDTAVMLGYTGALFKKFLGGYTGLILTSGIVIFWIIIPLFSGLRKFAKKDF